ncbi:MAG: murein biosynthesis integral membrane protein MurJ [Allosphingosinicella sp.]|uniref:murein biosynthesis integral membrane protein MurJ n=1 Tax=Allosphingosinicella sp. TaxID=2823234 RepID=UPI003961C9B3
MSLVRALGSIGSLTLVSRVLGFVRDMLMARFLGASFATDAFLVAFRLPNMFRALFAEGAFASAFVPMFNKKVGEEGGSLAKAYRFAGDALAVLLPVLIIFTGLMMIFAGPAVLILSGGFHDATPEQFAFAVQLARITFPYLLFIALVSLLGGILNSLGRFWVNAAAPIILNLVLICALLFFHGPTDYDTARAQAWGVTLAGALQLVWLVLACRQAGVKLGIRRPRLNDDVRQLMRLIMPAAAGTGAMQINLLVSTMLAARFLPEGSISYIYYADRLNQLPLGLVGIGLGTVLLPTIARMIASGDDRGALDFQKKGLQLALFLTLPATMALIVSAEPIIRGLLQYGAFTEADTIATAWALAAFSLGLPAYILIKVLTPGFHARADMKTPLRFALVAIAVNLVGNLILIWPLAHVGPPLATAIASWVNVTLLYLALRKRGHFEMDRVLASHIGRLAIAALLMAGALLVINPFIRPLLAGGFELRVLGLGLLVGGGFIVYAAASFATRAFTLAELKALMRRRKQA